MQRRRQGSRQSELFPRSKRPTIVIEENHRLVRMTDGLDWTELEELVKSIRRSKLKSPAGRPPHLRALIGAVLFRATRRMTYRETEDQIRHYGPARYLCGLTETEWSPDANTIQDFEQLLGEDGTRRLNEYVVKEAVDEGLADPTTMVADMTAQEARIPHPNEMGLMATFAAAVCAASQRAGGALKTFVAKAAAWFGGVRKRLREYRLFAKDKGKEVRNRLVAEMASLVERIQKGLGQALACAQEQRQRLRRYGKVALAKVKHLHETMKKLLPQIRYWLKTGRVAANKVISLWLPELYSIVRGKVGKAVEFGLAWGLRRLKGGFLLATVARQRGELHDSTYAVSAVDQHMAMFGKAPRSYAYDRAGYSRENIDELRRRGVRHVGLAPRGRCPWPVEGRIKERLVRERAQIEGGIGTIKASRYGFNRPLVRSVEAMVTCGQRAVLGFNLNKLVRQLAAREEVALAG